MLHDKSKFFNIKSSLDHNELQNQTGFSGAQQLQSQRDTERNDGASHSQLMPWRNTLPDFGNSTVS